MSKSTDERGRLYLPTAVRERYGDRYRIVELPSHVALVPVDEDPVAGLQAAVGDAFADVDSDSDEVDTAVRAAVARDAVSAPDDAESERD
jgi:bifunctional DNA-binding transcriptional regulator/antitoxin component of YhaV-PrlF toxin-antitoxin module